MKRGLVLSFCSAVLVLGMTSSVLADQSDRRLEGLFERLQATENESEARTTQALIWRIWIESDDLLVDRLMRYGVRAMSAGQHSLALDYFDRIIGYEPTYAEGWNKRATVHFLMGNYDASVRDIERVLALEPRHFGALSGLGMIYDALEQPAAALRSFEAALAINPHMPGPRQRVDVLKRQLRGRPT
ncbi:MAG: tetratricopeptide repeat protein [Pseudomonadota bacterium]